MKKFIIVIILLSLAPCTILPQSKVGTEKSQLLHVIPQSIRAGGMGQAGAALVDEYSFNYNPGSLGLFYLEDEISVSPYIWTDNLSADIKLKQPSLAAPIYTFNISNKTHMGITYGFSYIGIDFPEQVETSYQQPPEENIFDLKYELYDYSLGIGYSSSSIEIGLGGSYRHLKETINDVTSTANGVDVGVIFRVPLDNIVKLIDNDEYHTTIIPSIGYSYSFLGMGIRDYDIQRTKRLGIAVIFGIDKLKNRDIWRLCSLTPSFENEKIEMNESFNKYGAELGLLEAVYLRVGNYDYDNNLLNKTWGFTLNSGGVFKTILAIRATKSNNILKFFANRLTFQYSEAHFDHDFWINNEPFRGISLKYKLSRIN